MRIMNLTKDKKKCLIPFYTKLKLVRRYMFYFKNMNKLVSSDCYLLTHTYHIHLLC